MVCDVCGKKQATVHLTEIVDDSMSELHLCEECARKKSQQMENQFGLADLLAGLAEFGKPMEQKVMAEKIGVDPTMLQRMYSVWSGVMWNRG